MHVSSYRGNWFHQEHLLQSKLREICSKFIRINDVLQSYEVRDFDKHEITYAGANESDVY